MERALALCYPGGDHGPRMESKVHEYPADVVFGGALRVRELLGDLVVGWPSTDEERHLLLAGCAEDGVYLEIASESPAGAGPSR